MKSFKEFLVEVNDIVLATPKNIESPKPDHRRHPMGQFLQFIKTELPNVEGFDEDLENTYRKELDSHIDKLIGEDPTHFTALHKDLTTDDLEGGTKQADLYDVLHKVTQNVANNVVKRYRADPDDMRGIVRNVRNHMENRANQLIRGRARTNPKMRMIDTIMDIKI